MFEHKTFENVLQDMLDRVTDDVDKREGSIIYDALAPAAMELAETYTYMDLLLLRTFAYTADGEDLDKRVGEFGVNRDPATYAVRKATISDANGNPHDDVPLGALFQLNSINYEIGDKVSAGNYRVIAKTAGQVGNIDFGGLIPVEPIERLGRAELGEVIVPGADEETDEHLRQRYYDTVNEPAFGGNIADYKRKINAIDGVGGTKVYPVWQGGGTVKCTFIASDYSAPTKELINTVQTNVDPEVNGGVGLGIAPIGHQVTITGVQSKSINVETVIVLLTGTTIGQVQSEIEKVIEDYFLYLRNDWTNQTLTVRMSQIEARIVTIQGVEDVFDTKLNGLSNNVILEDEEIPILGTVTING
ncbi:baseplate J/gp47 family protein [Cytobacillus purgationiresistens]|uniref:Phage protein gp47/JayE n=1 Tax=Cytobacillus purgationiresistens TaxID=863449 RepID=A0ABU0AHM1_9BACI|nr:baseplate J/gp47 family protein [Cytobacillus purgationiresistens]MDQ0269928.1 putative phage protein gp47/JayE [Cytobacillus purgationiresistens]